MNKNYSVVQDCKNRDKATCSEKLHCEWNPSRYTKKKHRGYLDTKEADTFHEWALENFESPLNIVWIISAGILAMVWVASFIEILRALSAPNVLDF